MPEFLVSIRACPSYEQASVDEAVAQVLSDLGGAKAFAGPDKKVLVKPNLLSGVPPERAVTTHPAVVQAVVAAFLATGAAVATGDSPGFGSPRTVMEKAGLGEAVRSAGGSFASFDTITYWSKLVGRRFPVATEVSEADLLLNLPKLKTHGMMALSGAVKNLFGCMVGPHKSVYHLDHQTTEAFAAMLLDLAAALAPGLNIMDAVIAMDGKGPSHGRVRPAGLIIGSGDALALDFAVAEVIGAPVKAIPHLRLAAERGLPAADPANRRLIGLPGRRIDDFRLPVSVHPADWGLPAVIARFGRRFMTAMPRVTKTCRDCGICAGICPVKAIVWGGGRARIDPDKCIRCYCCDEMCPHDAIDLKQGLGARLWPWR